MIIHAYIRVLGDEDTIQAIHKETNVPGAKIKRLKARRGTLGDDHWWDWGTEPTALDTNDPDDGIKAILHGHRPIFPVIAKHAADVDIYLEIVARYSENDEPRGLCLSAETVLLISELGGAVDIDVVPLVREGA
jgi:hypothetical protein